jgi:hypothetical protein
VDLRSKLTNTMFENPIRQLRDAVVSFNDLFLTKRKIYLKHLVFLRSDIYERLVEQTSDMGKYYVIKVDWSDPEQLRHLLRQRVINNLDPMHEDAWNARNPPMKAGPLS